jgi:hypothetical protein
LGGRRASLYISPQSEFLRRVCYAATVRHLIPALLVITVAGSANAAIVAIWATEGGEKLPQGERRALTGLPTSRVFDGTTVRLEAARNETVSAALVIETDAAGASGIDVQLDLLSGPVSIRSRAVSGNGVFDWNGRPIELFYVRYLPIRGLSQLTWSNYDERHVPRRFRRPFGAQGIATPGTGWADRPDHDAAYPDIAVPIELASPIGIPASSSQLIWVDITVPKNTPAGKYVGEVRIRTAGVVDALLPIVLTVHGFTLPDVPTAATMVHLGYGDVNTRYLGERYPNPGPVALRGLRIRDRHFQLAHRHRIALVDANDGSAPWDDDAPRPEWLPRLDGSLFTPERGYDGPGVGVGNGVFAIGMYGSWGWQAGGEAAMRARTDAWELWFQTHLPAVERFLFLADESSDFAQTETWSRWVQENPGPGHALRTLATADWTDAAASMPSLDLAVSTLKVADRRAWEQARRHLSPERRWLYNGARPASGSLALEDDGVALRMWPWCQFKKGIHRWFVWESTYYENFQGGTGATDVFTTARTFGSDELFDPVDGETGWNYTNGDGVLFYPGTDQLFPSSSYGVDGPFASLRLKAWRRGIQDHAYLTLASKVDPEAVDAIVARMVPVVLWEVDIDQPLDPSYRHTDISWPTSPDVWEEARSQLAAIIIRGVAQGRLDP